MKLTNKTFDLIQNNWQTEGLKRARDGLSSLLLSLQINPLVRYDTQSQLCAVLAEQISISIHENYKARKNIPPLDVGSLLLLLDRRNDLITPIIHSWSYASMIHDEFIVSNNCISLENVPNRQPKDPKEMLLSIENDHFFRNNFNKNFGELGPILLSAVDSLKTDSKSQYKVETLADMKRFIEEYPETKRYASDLHNHVFLMTELGRLVSESNLMMVSESEQELACDLASYSDMLKKLTITICSSKVRGHDALRLVCLYSLIHGDKLKDLANLIKRLRTRSDITQEQIVCVQSLQEFYRTKPRNPLEDTVQRVARKIKHGVRGVDNVLTEYNPELSEILSELIRNNKSKSNEFAFFGPIYREEPPKKIIVYMIGGYTYDEAIVVDRLNRANLGTCRVILGGDNLHNFQSFMSEIVDAVRNSKE